MTLRVIALSTLLTVAALGVAVAAPETQPAGAAKAEKVEMKGAECKDTKTTGSQDKETTKPAEKKEEKK
ncbi:MAG: hypothetical protein N2111_01360 [Candidatus Sumerlaeaceae bacterium]|nr:hypothetical protein [Candidatus Sumerlaeaceae bacterium]